MSIPTPIDLDTWPRRESFEHYRTVVPCTYAVTSEIDVTVLTAVLRAQSWKTYPAQIWALASIVNSHAEFRMTVDDHGVPSTFDRVHPAFTVFNPERETFACVSAEFDEDFPRFHATVVELLTTHRAATVMFPQGPTPEATFDVSSLPWLGFSGFSLAIAGGFDHYRPIVTVGRYTERDGRTLLPVAFQIHHAAADGFHTARFFAELQALCDDAPRWAGVPGASSLAAAATERPD